MMWLDQFVSKLCGEESAPAGVLIAGAQENQSSREPLQIGVTCIGSAAARGKQHTSPALSSTKHRGGLSQQWRADLTTADVHGIFLQGLLEPLHARLYIEHSSVSRWVLHIQDMCGQSYILPPGVDNEAVHLRQYDRVRIDSGTWLQLGNLEVCVCCPASMNQELLHEPHARMVPLHPSVSHQQEGDTAGRPESITGSPPTLATAQASMNGRRHALQQEVPADMHVRVSGAGPPARGRSRQAWDREERQSMAVSGPAVVASLGPVQHPSSSHTSHGPCVGAGVPSTADVAQPRSLVVTQAVSSERDHVWITNISLRPSTETKRRSLEVAAEQRRRSLEAAAQEKRRSLDVMPPHRQRRSAEVQQGPAKIHTLVQQAAYKGSSLDIPPRSQLGNIVHMSPLFVSGRAGVPAACAPSGVGPSPAAVVDALLSLEDDVHHGGPGHATPPEGSPGADIGSKTSAPAPWVSHTSVTARQLSPPAGAQLTTTWATPQKCTSFGQVPSTAGAVRPRSHSGSPAAQAAAARASFETSKQQHLK